MTPSKLAPQLQSLLPILHIAIQKSMPSCSKGARGLSVLSREASIFTCTTNSLSLPLRQRPTRYAIHAGRNLPDKVLRYLRHLCYFQSLESVKHLLMFYLYVAIEIGPYLHIFMCLACGL